MIQPPVHPSEVAAVAALVALCTVGGVVLGRLYFRSVRSSAQSLVAGGSGAQLLAVTALRFVLLALALAGVARLGALPLLVVLGGLLVGRGMVLRGVDREVS